MVTKMEDLALDPSIQVADDGEPLEFLPEPEPRDVWCWVISVDDHLLESPTMFEGRVPARFADEAPRIVEVNGRPAWRFDGKEHTIVGFNGCAGRPMRQWHRMAMRYEDFRPAIWDPVARVHDMDISGVWAQLCFPSVVWGFAGRAFSAVADRDLGLACLRAYNSWMLEEWCGAAPERYIPNQLAYLADPLIAAAEVRANAERGIRAVSFSENPEALGFASVYSREWDPFFAACQDTGTVINLHVGSSGVVHRPSSVSPAHVLTALFPVNGIEAVVDWIFAKIPLRFPGLRVVLSEAGASWVPMVVERLRRAHRQLETSTDWLATDGDPVEHLQRTFYFTSIEDPCAFHNLDRIGADRVMLETDYPHADSSWPDNQELFRAELEHLDVATIEKVCFGNAAALYGHPAPPPNLLAAATLFQR